MIIEVQIIKIAKIQKNYTKKPLQYLSLQKSSSWEHSEAHGAVYEKSVHPKRIKKHRITIHVVRK